MKNKDWNEKRACLSKKALSKARADLTVDEWAMKGIVMLYYLCEFCGFYHLTQGRRTIGKQKLKAKDRRLKERERRKR